MATNIPGQRKGGPTLFITGLPDNADEETIIRHFERIDKTIKVKVIQLRRDNASLASKGCGSIEFVTQEDCNYQLLFVI